MTMIHRLTTMLLPLAAYLASTNSYAFNIDGDGHYALRGETRMNPAFSKETGTYQAIEQSFRLKGEARFNDTSSMFLEFRLFENPREAYLGDKAKPNYCQPRRSGTDSNGNPTYDNNCEGRPQDSGEPRYEPYTPKVTKAYIRYAFDYCILEAGRRGRNWGLGIFLDDGNKPFSQDASVFDGVTCNVNIQKSQTLGFSLGYDKLSETGSYIDNPYDYPYPPTGEDASETKFNKRSRRFGANDSGDDLDQYFFTIEYDDRKANAGASFTKQIGVYFAQINGQKFEYTDDYEELKGGSNTDLKFLDLYTGFYFGAFSFRNEILFRMGKSADPSWFTLGGQRLDDEVPATNKLQSIGLAGSFEWTINRSGATLGPAEYNKGDARRNALAFNYAFAPGDEDGYKVDHSRAEKEDYSESARDNKVTALAFHRNFKPALLLLNARPEADVLRVDGAFNPSRVLNASVYSLAYLHENQVIGNFEVKMLTAQLDKGMPSEVKSYYDTLPDASVKPVGYKGKSLGYELDLSYQYQIGREVDLGLAAALAAPGDAWKTSDAKPLNEYMIQSSVIFKF